MSNNWALIGLGFIAQRHLDAIRDTGGKLLLACDIDVSKKDKAPGVQFYTDYIKMSKDPLFKEIDWVAIATPNNLHFPMSMFFAKQGKHVLCEKPLVIDSQHVETLKLLPKEYIIYTMMQLRHNPELQAFKESINPETIYEGTMTLSMNRGDFYHKGWKGDVNQSGGLLFNIGVHYFDLLVWFFGEPINYEIYEKTDKRARGQLVFPKARILWSLSIDAPMDNQIRHLVLNGKHLDLTRHFENLHTKVYEDIKNGHGITLEEAGRSIKVVEKINKLTV